MLSGRHAQVPGEIKDINVKRLNKRPMPPRFGRKLSPKQAELASHICLDCGEHAAYLFAAAAAGEEPWAIADNAMLCRLHLQQAVSSLWRPTCLLPGCRPTL